MSPTSRQIGAARNANVVDLLRQRGCPVSTAEIRDLLGMDDKPTANVLRRMRLSGSIKRFAWGLWVLPSHRATEADVQAAAKRAIEWRQSRGAEALRLHRERQALASQSWAERPAVQRVVPAASVRVTVTGPTSVFDIGRVAKCRA